MTTVIRLLARKQALVERLDKTTAAEERDEIERQLEQVNTALDLLDRPGAGGKVSAANTTTGRGPETEARILLTRAKALGNHFGQTTLNESSVP